MAKVTYIAVDGAIRVVDVAPGLSVMEGAVRHGVAGIDGECGGQMACGSCHVFVEHEWFAKTGAPQSQTEETMIEFSVNCSERSRLGCQIKMSDALDGLVVRMPAKQP